MSLFFSPSGDKEKIGWPPSDYTTRFTAKPIDLEGLKRIRNTQYSKTIQGDLRSHCGKDVYRTSTTIMFPPKKCMPKGQIPESVKVGVLYQHMKCLYILIFILFYLSVFVMCVRGVGLIKNAYG